MHKCMHACMHAYIQTERQTDIHTYICVYLCGFTHARNCRYGIALGTIQSPVLGVKGWLRGVPDHTRFAQQPDWFSALGEDQSTDLFCVRSCFEETTLGRFEKRPPIGWNEGKWWLTMTLNWFQLAKLVVNELPGLYVWFQFHVQESLGA